MNKFVKKFLYVITTFANQIWWPFWSNYRWRNSTRHNIGIKPEDKVENLRDIEKLLKKLYKNFKWTQDGMDQLYDSITPPPRTYEKYCEGLLEDDCDGFHALVYHCLHNSNIECYLMSVCAVKSAHCVLVFYFDGMWRVIDYTSIYPAFGKLESAIADYNESFRVIYRAKSEVFFDGLLSYDYIAGKLHAESIEKVSSKTQSKN